MFEIEWADCGERLMRFCTSRCDARDRTLLTELQIDFIFLIVPLSIPNTFYCTALQDITHHMDHSEILFELYFGITIKVGLGWVHNWKKIFNKFFYLNFSDNLWKFVLFKFQFDQWLFQLLSVGLWKKIFFFSKSLRFF